MKEYIWQCLTQEQDWQKLLRKWIENRNLTCGQFVEEVSKKSGRVHFLRLEGVARHG